MKKIIMVEEYLSWVILLEKYLLYKYLLLFFMGTTSYQ